MSGIQVKMGIGKENLLKEIREIVKELRKEEREEEANDLEAFAKHLEGDKEATAPKEEKNTPRTFTEFLRQYVKDEEAKLKEKVTLPNGGPELSYWDDEDGQKVINGHALSLFKRFEEKHLRWTLDHLKKSGGGSASFQKYSLAITEKAIGYCKMEREGHEISGSNKDYDPRR